MLWSEKHQIDPVILSLLPKQKPHKNSREKSFSFQNCYLYFTLICWLLTESLISTGTARNFFNKQINKTLRAQSTLFPFGPITNLLGK